MKNEKNIKNFNEGWINLRGSLSLIDKETNHHFFLDLDSFGHHYIKVPKKFVLIYEDSNSLVVAINIMWNTYKIYFKTENDIVIGNLNGKTLYNTYMRKDWTPKANQINKLK